MTDKEKWYAELPSGRRFYGHPILLKYGLDWVNVFGIILIIVTGFWILRLI